MNGAHECSSLAREPPFTVAISHNKVKKDLKPLIRSHYAQNINVKAKYSLISDNNG